MSNTLECIAEMYAHCNQVNHLTLLHKVVFSTVRQLNYLLLLQNLVMSRDTDTAVCVDMQVPGTLCMGSVETRTQVTEPALIS